MLYVLSSTETNIVTRRRWIKFAATIRTHHPIIRNASRALIRWPPQPIHVSGLWELYTANYRLGFTNVKLYQQHNSIHTLTQTTHRISHHPFLCPIFSRFYLRCGHRTANAPDEPQVIPAIEYGTPNCHICRCLAQSAQHQCGALHTRIGNRQSAQAEHVPIAVAARLRCRSQSGRSNCLYTDRTDRPLRPSRCGTQQTRRDTIAALC